MFHLESSLLMSPFLVIVMMFTTDKAYLTTLLGGDYLSVARAPWCSGHSEDIRAIEAHRAHGVQHIRMTSELEAHRVHGVQHIGRTSELEAHRVHGVQHIGRTSELEAHRVHGVHTFGGHQS